MVAQLFAKSVLPLMLSVAQWWSETTDREELVYFGQ